MRNRKNGGYTLIETMIAIVILAIIVVPTGSSIVLSYKINAKTEALIDAQLRLTSAVEYLKFSGKTDDVESKYGVECKSESGGILLTYNGYQVEVNDSTYEIRK